MSRRTDCWSIAGRYWSQKEERRMDSLWYCFEKE